MIKRIDSYRRNIKRQDSKQRRAVWLNKIKRHAIRNLMLYIVFGMGGVYLLDFFLSPALGYYPSSFLVFDLGAIMRGQVWRFVTFIIYPPSSSIMFVVFTLYFYWLVGTYLENYWGSFKFNLFYFCGMFGTMLAGLITGYATNHYINLSLFLAFAITYPNFEFLIFFILPVKAKWLALIDGLLYLYLFIYNNWQGRVALLFSLLNIFIFFSGAIKQIIYNAYRRAQWKRNYKNSFRG